MMEKEAKIIIEDKSNFLKSKDFIIMPANKSY